jgi:hypothetical protein
VRIANQWTVLALGTEARVSKQSTVVCCSSGYLPAWSQLSSGTVADLGGSHVELHFHRLLASRGPRVLTEDAYVLPVEVQPPCGGGVLPRGHLADAGGGARRVCARARGWGVGESGVGDGRSGVESPIS